MISFDSVLAQLYPLLNASGSTDLVFWTTAELYAWMDEVSRRLGMTGVFTARDTSTAVTAGGAAYLLPSAVLSVSHVSLDGAALRAANVRELEALSPAWDADSGTVERFVLDVAGTRTIALYRVPAAGGTLQLVFATWPAVAAGGTYNAPAALAHYYKYAALAAARGKDSDGAAPDVALAAKARASLLEQACLGLWGGAK